MRTGFVAWLFCRAIFWTAVAADGGWPLADLGEAGFGRGAPLWVALVEGLDGVAGLTPVGGSALLAAVGELAVLAGAIAVYRFARKDELPHTAERATWLWLAVPAAALTLPVSAWTFAASAAAVGLASLRGQRWVAATLALFVAAGFRPEVLLLGPGVAWLALHHYRPAKDPGWGPWAVGLTPLVAFTGFIGTATLLAGRWGVSVRSLHPHTRWRSDWVWQGLNAEATGVIIGICALLAVGLVVRAVKKAPAAWVLLVAPPLAWPLLHDPVFPAVGPVLFALPAFVVVGRALDDRRLERPVLAAALAGLLICAV